MSQGRLYPAETQQVDLNWSDQGVSIQDAHENHVQESGACKICPHWDHLLEIHVWSMSCEGRHTERLLFLIRDPQREGKAPFCLKTLVSSSNGWDSAAILGQAVPLGMVEQKGGENLDH